MNFEEMINHVSDFGKNERMKEALYDERPELLLKEQKEIIEMMKAELTNSFSAL